jgi:CheY-like chemotaxis protein
MDGRQALDADDASARRGRRAGLLLVEDDPDHRAVVREVLEDEGYRVETAVHGRDALGRLLAGPPPDLILLDLMMPEMDGFEFLDRVRDDDELHEIPIVVLTAKELTESERAFLAERTILILSKSAQPISSLGAALTALARQRAPARAGAGLADRDY